MDEECTCSTSSHPPCGWCENAPDPDSEDGLRRELRSVMRELRETKAGRTAAQRELSSTQQLLQAYVDRDQQAFIDKFAKGVHEIADSLAPARASAVAVDARCAAAHKEELSYAAWAAALVTVLVCLGQLAAERASPKIVGSRFKWMEVD